MIEIQAVTGYGQIKNGDVILIEHKKVGIVFPAKVKDVINTSDTKEEIVISIKSNCYFILSMVFSGESWVKNVSIVKSGRIFSVSNSIDQLENAWKE